jgi:pilus assembly protein FimV
MTACFVVPALGHAAGLGRLTVNSALGEPLRAEVEVTSLQPNEAESLAARLASPDAFRQAGIEYGSSLMSIRVALERRDGRPVVRLTSSRPINEPFLNVLLELQWSQGRLVREFTFLLDPPGYREKPAAAAAPAPAPTAADAATVARVSPAPTAPEARPLAPQPAPSAQGYEIKRGDTLGRIARDNQPEGVTFQQMLVALYRANQGAFINNNINLIRTGRILQIPDREAISAIAAGEANQVVRKHMADFAEYRAKLGAAVTAAPASTTPSQREATGRIAAKPEPQAPGAAKDQLKLSRADAKPSSSAAQAAREDDRTSSSRALQEAQSRVTDLEKNVSDLQKLLEIKNKQLAQLEQKAGAAPAAAAKDAPKPAAETPKPAPVAAAPVAKPAAEAPQPAPEAKPAEAPKPAAQAPKPAPKPAPVAAKPKPAPPAPEPSLVDEFLGNPVALGGLAGVLLLLIGYGVYAWRRKKAMQSRFQDSVMATEPVLAPHPQPSAHAAETAAAVSAAVAATQASAAGPEADEVDPIAEADVYLAYGRDAQAEEILREALSRHPERVAVHMKLLEIFAQRHDARGFADTARKVQELTHGAGPEWEKACVLGHSIDPENPLYGAAAGKAKAEVPAVAAAAATAPSVDFDLGGSTNPGGGGRATTLDIDIGGATTPGGESQPFKPGDTVILQPGEAATGSAPQAKAEDKLDFDLGDLRTPAAPAQPAATPSAPAASASLDFDLNLDDLGAPKGAQPAAAAPVDLSAISLDLGTPATAGTTTTSSDPRWQEVATKLDLAKAYQGMGDKDGARALLNEVVSQGDAAQQSEAKQLLSALG